VPAMGPPAASAAQTWRSVPTRSQAPLMHAGWRAGRTTTHRPRELREPTVDGCRRFPALVAGPSRNSTRPPTPRFGSHDAFDLVADGPPPTAAARAARFARAVQRGATTRAGLSTARRA
jgi:hypothetical protein